MIPAYRPFIYEEVTFFEKSEEPQPEVEPNVDQIDINIPFGWTE